MDTGELLVWGEGSGVLDVVSLSCYCVRSLGQHADLALLPLTCFPGQHEAERGAGAFGQAHHKALRPVLADHGHHTYVAFCRYDLLPPSSPHPPPLYRTAGNGDLYAWGVDYVPISRLRSCLADHVIVSVAFGKEHMALITDVGRVCPAVA